MILTKEILSGITKTLDFDEISPLLEKYEINTVNRIAGFFAQCSHESAEFKVLQENLNYSADALLKVFPKYFPDRETAEQYARKPEKIANKIYANRMGNGDEASGDGYRYRGRGYIQLTGKSNYSSFAAFCGKNIDDVLDYCITPKGALESAIFYWVTRKINQFCDNDDIKGMTKAINGGYNGLDDRQAKYSTYKSMLLKNSK